MNRFVNPLLFLTLILVACSPNISTPESFPAPTIQPATDTASVNPCAYQWANQDIPELTAQFDSAVKALIPNSTSRASAFGENCISTDGQVIRFGAIETDFYVSVSVKSITNYETFGGWIAQVMQVVNSLPPDLLIGPNQGFVEFRFEKSLSETIGLRVPIQQYNDSAKGITGENLFRRFYTTP